MKYLDELDVTAIDAGAVNTINNISGRLIGYNTDGDGLVTSLAQDLGFTPEGRTILVLGAGGAARGALAALGRAGAGRIMVYNRTCDAAIALASDMTVRYPGTIVTALNDVRELEAALVESDLLINATSVGMHDEVMPSLRPELLPGTAKVYDMVYAPPMTPLLSVATSRGLRCANGFGMLAAQGELAFSIWTGVKPPVGLMLRVLTDICNT
jgi:shikimate dehydrogenase